MAGDGANKAGVWCLMLRRLAPWLAAAMVTLGLSMGWFSKFQRRMVFPGSEDVTLELLHNVAANVGATEIQVPTADGETLYGWHRNAVQTGPRRVVLYFHGNASSVLGPLELQNLLVSEGWDFVGIHYRGYPGSTGTSSEAGVREDARAAWDWIRRELGAKPGRIAIHGRSLGGGVAVQLAAAMPAGALVMESTFTSVVDLAKEIYPFLPAGRLLEHRFMTRDYARKVTCPVLVAHGTGDTTIDVRHGKELARLFRTDEYVEVPRIDHNEILFEGTAADRYLKFLDRAIPVAE